MLFCQKADIAMPKELVSADGEAVIERYFQDSARKKEDPLFNSGRSFLGNRFRVYLFPVNLPFGIRF